MRNVGSTERFVRLGYVVAAIAAARASGWSHAALNTVATAGPHYRLSRYCPVHQDIGPRPSHQLSLLDAELSACGSRL
jgi:hypothetical protein